VIPAYQAGLTLGSVFQRLPAQLEEKRITYLVVNDGSTDNTAQVIAAEMARRPNVRVIHQPENRGYAQAQKAGYTLALESGADVAVLLHADGQYAPEILPQLLAPLENNEADVVQGSRMIHPMAALRGGMPLYKWVANLGLSTMENFVYGMKLAEYHSGYMLYSRRSLEAIPFLKLSDTFHFDGEMLIMSGKKRLRVKQIAIPTHYGEEKSHLKPIRYGIDVLGIMYRYRRGHYDFPAEAPPVTAVQRRAEEQEA
jgi:glycosyltransferase involved in cell wall biosynthesis